MTFGGVTTKSGFMPVRLNGVEEMVLFFTLMALFIGGTYGVDFPAFVAQLFFPAIFFIGIIYIMIGMFGGNINAMIFGIGLFFAGSLFVPAGLKTSLWAMAVSPASFVFAALGFVFSGVGVGYLILFILVMVGYSYSKSLVG